MLFSFSAVEAARFRSLPEYNDPCPFGYGTDCSKDTLDPATKAQVGAILEGILKNLQGKAGLVSITQKTDKSATATKTKATRWSAPVNRALLAAVTLQRKNENHATAKQALAKILSAEAPSAGCKYFGVCSPGENPPLDPAVKAQVGAILEGMLKNLQSKN